MKKLMYLVPALILISCSQYDPSAGVSKERQRDYASALFNQKLYIQSINEYVKLLENYDLNDDLRANINYTVGNIFFENVGDYRNSLSFYLKIKHVFRESDLVDDANKKIIASLERLGRPDEAAAVLEETVSLNDPAPASDSPFELLPGDTVAVIDGLVLTSGDFERLFEYYYNAIPADQKDPDNLRNDKLAFLRDHVKREVLYNSAKRRSLDEDQEVLEVAYLQKKQLMIEKLLQNDIYAKVIVEDSEIENYYQENKEKLIQRNPDGSQSQLSLDESRAIIFQLLSGQQANILRDQLTDQLIEAQNAKVFADRIK